ncbi:MAG: PepSY-like domain-containing protein [Bacteroidota bacterium]
MKKIAYLALVLVALFTLNACEEGLFPNFELGSITEISIDELPATVLETVEERFPNSSIVEALEILSSDQSTLFAVSLDNGRELSFNRRGGMCNDSISLDSLPTAINTYVDTAYTGEVIVKAVSFVNDEGATIYVVRMSSGEVLSFDDTGAFLGVRPTQVCHRRGTRIEAVDLPQAVQTAVSTDYPATTIDKTAEISLADGTLLYVVKLDDDTRLLYDSNGLEVDPSTVDWTGVAGPCKRKKRRGKQ